MKREDISFIFEDAHAILSDIIIGKSLRDKKPMRIIANF